MRRVLRKVPADLILDPVVGQISQERMVCEMEESDAEDNAERVKTRVWGRDRMIIARFIGSTGAAQLFAWQRLINKC